MSIRGLKVSHCNDGQYFDGSERSSLQGSAPNGCSLDQQTSLEFQKVNEKDNLGVGAG